MKYEYSVKVEYIKNRTRTEIGPMEKRFKDELDPHKIYNELLSK